MDYFRASTLRIRASLPTTVAKVQRIYHPEDFSTVYKITCKNGYDIVHRQPDNSEDFSEMLAKVLMIHDLLPS